VVMCDRMVDRLKIPGSHKRAVIEAQVVPRELWMVVLVLMNAHHQLDVVDRVVDLVLMVYCRYENFSRGFWIPSLSVVLGKVVYGVFFFTRNRDRSVFFVSGTVRKDFLIENSVCRNEHMSSVL